MTRSQVLVKWYGGHVADRSDDAVDGALEVLALETATRARNSMLGPKSGRDYRPRWKQQRRRNLSGGTSHLRFVTRSSAPGEAPANQRGRLKGSITVRKPRKLTRDVGSNLPYARVLEYGNRDGTLKPRPDLRPAVQAVFDSIYRRIMEGRLK